MLKQEDIEKIKRYTDGLSSDAEKYYVDSLFQNGDKNDDLRHLLKTDWEANQGDLYYSEVNLTNILDKVHHMIRKKENLKREKLSVKFVRIYTRIAAILILPILIAGGIIYIYARIKEKTIVDQSVSSTIYAPYGSRVSFNLPDGTKGMLNSGSNLSYSLPFCDDRQVILEGEAWFEVKHDEEHPLKINTCNSSVKVLGTNFNISAYPTENYIEVVLQNGKVEFENKKVNKKVTMHPYERLVFTNDTVTKSITDPAKYSAWTEGKLVFRGDPMAEVCRRLERWYNVKVILADSSLAKYSFRATFEDDSLSDVLRFLSMTSPIRYSISPRQLMKDGTCKKEVVTIDLKN
jgi:transmembrane sensor